jgi:hypothetical protein
LLVQFSVSTITISLCLQIAFSGIVFPSLLAAYIGQAAYLLKHNTAEDVSYTFYKSVPSKSSSAPMDIMPDLVHKMKFYVAVGTIHSLCDLDMLTCTLHVKCLIFAILFADLLHEWLCASIVSYICCHRCCIKRSMNTEDNSCNKSFSLEGGWATNCGRDA